MRFKHITLQGYKSFANKSEFYFPTGITAIVGPNGSGKSNVADAIRWVLGEQRMSSLRGKSTSDMIYAGGRRRVRAGMAEVCITLDNSDNWLPIEFSEVSITRRAYHSGENQYLINGSKVRLRDISEMLAAGGLSQSAYTVIGQGLVDAALALRAQERRALFEEAAGISVYRRRREDALDRLDETQRNLDRVRDILREITPRLRRLEREMERIEEHQRLIAHLERLQRTWYGYHWGEQQTKLAQALEKAAYLESNLKEQRQKAAALSERLVQQRQQEANLRAQLRDWYRESADLIDQVNETRQDLAVAQERTRLLHSRREELLAELAPMEEQVSRQDTQVEQARRQIQEAKRELAEKQQQLAEQETEWEAVRQQALEPVERRERVERELLAKRAEIEPLNQALADARAEAARLSGELEALNRMGDAQAIYDAGVQALLQAGLDGVLGPLGAQIQVDPRWETAIEAALGNDLQAVIVERTDIVEQARHILASSGGRLTLLPLDNTHSTPSLPKDALPAARVVTCDTQMQPAVETLLGSIALCNDLATARAQIATMPPGSRCVTPDGTVLRADGALSLGKAAASGTLATERARRELPAQLEAVEQRIQQIEKQRQHATAQVETLKAQLNELEEQVKAANKAAAQMEQETLGRARTGVAVAEETLRSRQAALEREIDLAERIRAQMAARRQRVKELETERETLVAQTETQRSTVIELEAQLNKARESTQPAEDQLTRLGKEQTAVEEQERTARDRARDVEARHGRAQLEVDRCQDELKLLARRIEEDLGLVELELTDEVTAQTPLPLHPIVSELPIVEVLPQGLEEEIRRLKARLRRLGGVNPSAPDDYDEIKERHAFLTEQSADLEAASAKLHQVIAELDEMIEVAFQETFDAVAKHFAETFTILFNGGAARLELTEPEDLMSTGVDIIARPPGKRSQRLALLSGGERSLTAVALLFSILKVSPAPFCVLDEVDAMLDEANVGRFRGLLESLAEQTQFIVITHNRGTVEAADTIYGISMGADGVSEAISLKMDE